MKKIIVAIVLFVANAASAANLIVNGDFSNGLQNWNANKETLSNSNQEFESNVVTAGAPWDWNLSYPLALQTHVEYKLTFKAKASQPREIIAGWGMNAAPWAADVQNFSLSTEWQTFEYVGYVSYEAVVNSRLIFDYGHQFGVVYIDDVSLEEVPETNLLTNGDFADGLIGWQANQQTSVSDYFSSTVTWTGNPWDWSLSQAVALKAGVNYRLTFKAKASVERTINTGWGKNEFDWQAHLETVTLTTNWRVYHVEGQVSFGDYPNSRIIFDYGDQLGTIDIDDVVFEEVPVQTTFVTEDATYVLGESVNEQGDPIITEVFFDIGAGYLTPKVFNPHGAGWIIDNAQASTVDGDILMSTVEFKGLYIEDCFNGEWINVLNTEYAYNSNPLTIIDFLGMFSLNHFYVKTYTVTQPPLRFLDERFLCDQENDPAEYEIVALPGIDEDGDGLNDEQIILVEGSARFAYVVEHH